MVVRMQRCSFNLGLLHLLKDFRKKLYSLFVLCCGVIPPESSRGQSACSTPKHLFLHFSQSFQIFVSTVWCVALVASKHLMAKWWFWTPLRAAALWMEMCSPASAHVAIFHCWWVTVDEMTTVVAQLSAFWPMRLPWSLAISCSVYSKLNCPALKQLQGQNPFFFLFFLMECSYPVVQRDTKWLPCIMQV